MTRLDALRDVAIEADALRLRRDLLIRKLRHEGHTIREIAEAARMSVGGVHRIATRIVGSVFTIGYAGAATVDAFVERLVEAEVDELLDVRMNAVSRRKGFSKSALRAAASRAGVQYSHLPTLGNPRELRPLFRNGHLQEARRNYLDHVNRHHPDGFHEVLERARGRRLALMCVEADAISCHRICITDETQAIDPGVAVNHL